MICFLFFALSIQLVWLLVSSETWIRKLDLRSGMEGRALGEGSHKLQGPNLFEALIENIHSHVIKNYDKQI